VTIIDRMQTFKIRGILVGITKLQTYYDR